MWPEVQTAKSENRRELVLSGREINERLNKEGLDDNIFRLTDLNYLNITNTNLIEIPDEITKLINLQTLVLHSNKIKRVNESVGKLAKLKTLDLSRNAIAEVANGIVELPQIVSLNFSNNVLDTFPNLSANSKLTVLDLSNNKLTTFPLTCNDELTNLSEIKLRGNAIEVIPETISLLPSLKLLDLSENKIKTLPGELADCQKLKELNLKSNPISDRRLLKLIDQCRTKQIVDYVRQHCPKTSTSENKTVKKGKNSSKNTISNNEDNEITYKYTITIKRDDENDVKVKQTDLVKNIREHIVCCVVKNVTFAEETFKKFIQLQNKLHDTICDKRNSATIATHDYNKLGNCDVTYTTLSPRDLVIKPLNRPVEMTGAELFARLQTEANNLRKEKKRNTYSGIHKYLYLIEGKPTYPCLLNGKNEVVSFPPITNSDTSKIEVGTKDVFVEVTSSTSQFVCKTVLDQLLREMAFLFETDLVVQQVRIFDAEDRMKLVYPSKNDLNFDKNVPIKVIH